MPQRRRKILQKINEKQRKKLMKVPMEKKAGWKKKEW